MLIAIVSDSHDNEPNTLACLNFCRTNNVAALIHCGDITTAETLELFAQHFGKPIDIVLGNGDWMVEQLETIALQYDHVTVHGEVGEVIFDTTTIGFTHYPDSAHRLAENGKYDLVFYGHTHIPWEEKINNVFVRNPGPLSGTRNRATFALYDTATGKAQLKLIEKL